MIFSLFGEPVGSRFLASFLFFLGLRLSILRVSSEVCFLVGLGQKMMPGSVVGCAENIINTMVLLGSTGITRTSFGHKLSIEKQPEHQNATKA